MFTFCLLLPRFIIGLSEIVTQLLNIIDTDSEYKLDDKDPTIRWCLLNVAVLNIFPCLCRFDMNGMACPNTQAISVATDNKRPIY